MANPVLIYSALMIPLGFVLLTLALRYVFTGFLLKHQCSWKIAMAGAALIMIAVGIPAALITQLGIGILTPDPYVDTVSTTECGWKTVVGIPGWYGCETTGVTESSGWAYPLLWIIVVVIILVIIYAIKKMR